MFTATGKTQAAAALCLIACSLLIAGGAVAQSEPALPEAYSAAELEELVGPVALYPDDLLAIILPASAYPLQIVQAARYLEEYEQNPDLKPNDDWDDAVVALLNYPEIIELMNQDLDWTWQLGEAVVNQQPEVLDAVQQFRDRAYLAGNLATDERQVVSTDEGVIEIEPADPEVIYVPYYEPERVVVYQSTPVYRYYPRPYPVYYYPYPSDYWFASRLFWGVTTFYTLAWLSDGLHLHHHDHDSHPYYQRTYHTHHYVRHHYRHSSHDVYVNRSHRPRYGRSDRTRYDRRYRGDAWRPAKRHGARPGYRRHDRHREPITASTFSNPRQRDDAIRKARPARRSSPAPTPSMDHRSTIRPDSGDIKRKRVIRTRKDQRTLAHSRPTARSDQKTVRTIRRSQRQHTSARADTRAARTRIKSTTGERQKSIRVRQSKPASRPTQSKPNMRVAQSPRVRSRAAPQRTQARAPRSAPKKVAARRSATHSAGKSNKIAKTSTRKSGANKSKARSKDRKSRS
jgi:hypothetical protein